jgi:SAM-dependent methyltransferase
MSCSLNIQHRFFKTISGQSKGITLPLDPSKVEVILDVATGTGSWTLDVAQNPVIASRLSSPTDNLRLLACDISLAKLSPELLSHSTKIEVFEQDVTQSFPTKLQGKVDIVHMGLLLHALTERGWRKALRNIFDVLSKSSNNWWQNRIC